MNHRPIIILAAFALAGCAAPKPAAPVPPAAPAAAIPPAPPPPSEPRSFVDLSATGLRAVFGAPQFVRRDGAGEMWRYDGASCRAFFFLYGENAARVVRHVETLPHGAASAADPACLAALRASPTKPS
jgi:hypothetical protein